MFWEGEITVNSFIRLQSRNFLITEFGFPVERHRDELKFPICDEGKCRNLLEILEYSSPYFSEFPS